MVKRYGLSGAALKAIACVCMAIDHAGVLLFPREEWMRCIGRLAFPRSLAALPLLALYNGTAGEKQFQYGFYVFYPLHLTVLQMIAWIK